jgi:AcrR family transcriptional regulator
MLDEVSPSAFETRFGHSALCETVRMVTRQRQALRGGRPTLEQAVELDRDISESALRLFLEHGYEGASMEAIAQAARTTKASLYSRFPNKESLFNSVLKWATQRQDWPLPEAPLVDVDDLEGSLAAIAETSVRRALHPDMIKLSRIAVVQASRFPEIAQQTQIAHLWRRQDVVADLLRRHAAAGTIVAEDPDALAELFLVMASGVPARLASFGVVRDAAEQANQTRTAVEVFLRGISPR